MTSLDLFLAVAGMGFVTYAIRVSLFLLPDQVAIPGWIMRSLRYVPAAVLSAIIIPEILLPSQTLDLSLGNERLIAGLAAGAVAWRTRNVFFTVGVGMLLLWTLQFIG